MSSEEDNESGRIHRGRGRRGRGRGRGSQRGHRGRYGNNRGDEDNENIRQEENSGNYRENQNYYENREQENEEISYHNSNSSSRGRGRGRGGYNQSAGQRNEDNKGNQNEEISYHNSSSSSRGRGRGRGRGRNNQNTAQRNEDNQSKIIYENINDYKTDNLNKHYDQRVQNNNNTINNKDRSNREDSVRRGQAPNHRGRGRDTRPQEERDQDPPALPQINYKPYKPKQNTQTFNLESKMNEELKTKYIRKIFKTLFCIHKPVLLKSKDIVQMNELCDPIFNIFNGVNSLFPQLDNNSFRFIFLQLSKLKLNFSPLEFLNLCHIIDSLLDHLDYLGCLKSNYQIIQRTYSNNHFEQFLLKKSKHLYFYNEYLIEEFMPLGSLISVHKRRPLDIDGNLFFNYIPLLCPGIKKHQYCKYGEKCIYSHTLNEILYHPLVYKKIPCPLQDECDKENCPKYHSFLDIDYDIDLKTNETISSICEYISAVCLNKIKTNDDNFERQQTLLNSFIDLEKDPTQSFTSSIPSEYVIEQLYTEFNPKTYKTKLCPFGKLCKLDVKLCLYYHDEYDKRRDTYNYKYSHEICPYKVEENGINPSGFCPKENTCEYAHNVYEHMYHPIIFRTNECPNENDCKYYLICPFEHTGQEILPLNENDDNEEQVLGNHDVIKNYYVHKLKKFKESQTEYLDNLKKKVNHFCCNECIRERGVLKNSTFNLKKISETNAVLLCTDCSEKCDVKIDMSSEENKEKEKME